jgi:hypothetical protein
MSVHHSMEVAERLKLALNDGRIPSSQHALGTQVLSLLQNAVKTTIVGLPGSGKTKLINMMLGENLLLSIPGISITEVVYGREPKTTFVYSDGTLTHHKGLPAQHANAHGAIRARIELPENVLRHQTFTEISLTGSPDQQIQMFQQVAALGQVTIWCSEQFGSDELAIWKTAPETTKDHSFLALTMADRLLMKNLLIDRIQDLGPVVCEEFLGLYPVATLQAIAARADGKNIEMDLWESSGGKDFVLAIQDQVNSGRSAEMDRASMLLAQFGDMHVNADPATVPTKPSDTVSTHTVSPEHPRPKPAKSGDVRVVDRIHAHLQHCADKMLSEARTSEQVKPDWVIDQCCEAITEISHLIEADSPVQGELADILNDVRDSEEVLLLMQVEKGPKAAEDAVVLMLQLKKELSEATCEL